MHGAQRYYNTNRLTSAIPMGTKRRWTNNPRNTHHGSVLYQHEEMGETKGSQHGQPFASVGHATHEPGQRRVTGGHVVEAGINGTVVDHS